jgi:hypothetical protein
MKKYPQAWVQDWCDHNGWTELFIERYHYWAFPPGAVMPQPIPLNILESIRKAKGDNPSERSAYLTCLGLTMMGVGGTCYWDCPLPLVLAFTVTALVVAYWEDD